MGGVKRNSAFLLIMLCFFQLAVGQDKKNDDPPQAELERLQEEYPWFNRTKSHYGGEIITAGKYHLEIVSNVYNTNEKLCVYVIKRRKEIKLKNVAAEAELKYKDGHKETVKMHQRDNHLALDSFNVALPANITLRINMKGKSITGVYYYSGIK